MTILLTLSERKYKVNITQQYSFVNSDETTISCLVIKHSKYNCLMHFIIFFKKTCKIDDNFTFKAKN